MKMTTVDDRDVAVGSWKDWRAELVLTPIRTSNDLSADGVTLISHNIFAILSYIQMY
jgi:hypothetical protein